MTARIITQAPDFVPEISYGPDEDILLARIDCMDRYDTDCDPAVDLIGVDDDDQSGVPAEPLDEKYMDILRDGGLFLAHFMYPYFMQSPPPQLPLELGLITITRLYQKLKKRGFIAADIELEDLKKMKPPEMMWYLTGNITTIHQFKQFAQHYVIKAQSFRKPEPEPTLEEVLFITKSEAEMVKGLSFEDLRLYYLSRKDIKTSLPVPGHPDYSCTYSYLHPLVFLEPKIQKSCGTCNMSKKLSITDQLTILTSTVSMVDLVDTDNISALVKGAPGVGKSSVVNHCVRSWALGPEKAESTLYRSNLINKKLVFHISRINECSTLYETMRHSLGPIPTRRKDKAMKLLNDSPEACLVFVDDLHLFNNRSVVDGILDIARDRKINIIVTCNEKHSYIKDAEVIFKNVTSVLTYSPSIHYEDNISLVRILNECFHHYDAWYEWRRGKLGNILGASVRRSTYDILDFFLLSLLYDQGEIFYKDMAGLNTHQLYAFYCNALIEERCREKALVLSGGKYNKQHLEEYKRLVAETMADLASIQKVALHSMTCSDHNGYYTEDQLKDLGVDINSPYMALLKKVTKNNSIIYFWIHTRIAELQGIFGITRAPALYAVASRPRNHQFMMLLVRYLSTINVTWAVKLVTAVLLLQNGNFPCMKNSLKKDCKCGNVRKIKDRIGELGIDQVIMTGSFNSNSVELIMPTTDEIKDCINPAWLTTWLENSGTLNLSANNALRLVRISGVKMMQMNMFIAVFGPFLPTVTVNLVQNLEEFVRLARFLPEIETRAQTLGLPTMISEYAAVPEMAAIIELNFFIYGGRTGKTKGKKGKKARAKMVNTTNVPTGMLFIIVTRIEYLLRSAAFILDFGRRMSGKVRECYVLACGHDEQGVRTSPQDEARLTLNLLAEAIHPEQLMLPYVDRPREWLTKQSRKSLRGLGVKRVCFEQTTILLDPRYNPNLLLQPREDPD